MGKPGAVLVDSQLWIAFFSREKSRETQEVERLIRSRSVVLAGPVLYELLVGPRQEGERRYLQGRLRAFPLLEATHEVWLKAVDLGRLPQVLKRRVPFSDVLIAAHAMVHRVIVFATDPHFDVFPDLQRHRLERR